MASQRLHVEVVGFGGEDEEGHHRDVGMGGLQVVVESGQGLDEDVGTFVAEFVATGDEEVEGLVEVEVVVAVEVAADEFVDFVFREGVQVLEFVEGGEFFHVEAVGGDDVGFAFEEVLRFETWKEKNLFCRLDIFSMTVLQLMELKQV